jgi:hypothetical protein
VAGDDLELDPDRRQQLADSGVEVAAEALALALNLTDGASAGGTLAAQDDPPELGFDGLQPHHPFEEAIFQLDQRDSGLSRADFDGVRAICVAPEGAEPRPRGRYWPIGLGLPTACYQREYS